jgi:hypothetical protein
VFPGVSVKIKDGGLWFLPRWVLLPRQGFPRVTRGGGKFEKIETAYKADRLGTSMHKTAKSRERTRGGKCGGCAGKDHVPFDISLGELDLHNGIYFLKNIITDTKKSSSSHSW